MSNNRVPMPTGKSWMFFLKIPGTWEVVKKNPWKSCIF